MLLLSSFFQSVRILPHGFCPRLRPHLRLSLKFPSNPLLHTTLKHSRKEIIHEHTLRIKLLPLLQIPLQRILITSLRKPLNRPIPSLIDMRNATMLFRNLRKRKTKLQPFWISRILIFRIDGHHVSNSGP
ncbi:hypothetical protein KCU92_g227, partial [Aureobasidium melanogenum]